MQLLLQYRLKVFLKFSTITFVTTCLKWGWYLLLYFGVANGFAGIGIPGETLDMQSADIIAAVSDGNGGCEVHDYWAITFADPGLDKDEGGTDDVVEKTCEIVDGSIKASFVRPLSTGDVKDRDFLSTKTPLIYAYYPDSDGLIYHGPMK